MNNSASGHSATDLPVYLSYFLADEEAVSRLYTRLKEDGFQPWMEGEDVLPGQNTSLEISRAIKKSQVMLVCLSKQGLSTAGALNRGIKFALDKADEQPEGAISVISLRLDECDIPTRLDNLKPLDLFPDFERGYGRLVRSLEARAASLGLTVPPTASSSSGAGPQKQPGSTTVNNSGGVNISGGQVGDVNYTDNRNAVMTNNHYYNANQPSTAGSSSPSNPPTNPATARLDLTFQEMAGLVNRLLACPVMSNPGSISGVVGNLPTRIANAVSYSPQIKQYVTEIVKTCLNFPDGLKSLLEVVRFHDDGTLAFKDLESYATQLKI